MDTQHNEGETKFEQDFKELNVYLDVLCKNGHDVKDAGHTWIAFSDKFRNFKERILAALPATPPTPVSRTAEEILERHLKKCNDLGFLKQSSPDKYNAIIAAINEALNITTNKVDDFLRMHPEFRCLDVIGKFSKVIRTQPEEREERVSEKGCPFDEQLP